jgi:hypothetical protein
MLQGLVYNVDIWKKKQKFEVGVNYVENRGYSSSIPKPIIEILGKPNTIKFVINKGNKVELLSGKTSISKLNICYSWSKK